ncbi:MAG: carbohydrate ABC transporter permease [Termitinemataceae bacterium]|nr:MAG: carbohydrate ABC transporter permease [Termitinemataceae bacterium]
MSRRIKSSKDSNPLIIIFLVAVSLIFLAPLLLVLLNSFKTKLFVVNTPFNFPTAETFAGIKNFSQGLSATEFFFNRQNSFFNLGAFFLSLFITVCSVVVIVLFSGMTAWYITRSKSRFCKILYFAFVFAMIVPFQMVMFPLSHIANRLYLDNPMGILFIYLGFGAGSSIFLYSGFVKSIPVAVEEAAIIDGCSPVKTFFLITLPMLAPISITVAIINAMWVWNDYLLPYLVLDFNYKTIPIAVQYLRGGKGSVDMGHMMAVVTVAVIPIVIFYFACQKHIVQGITSGSIKG